MLRVRLFGKFGEAGPSRDGGPVDAVVYPRVDGGPLLLLAGDLVWGGGVGSAYDGGSMGRPPFARVFCLVIDVLPMVPIKSSTYWVMLTRANNVDGFGEWCLHAVSSGITRTGLLGFACRGGMVPECAGSATEFLGVEVQEKGVSDES